MSYGKKKTYKHLMKICLKSLSTSIIMQIERRYAFTSIDWKILERWLMPSVGGGVGSKTHSGVSDESIDQYN